MKHQDIVTIGNGTGQGIILRTLRKITDLDRVTALVGVTDNGGHSGALRREMNCPSMGDVKTIIAALTGETVWGQLIRHRFKEGRLKGVSMGNLILASLTDEGRSLLLATRRLVQALDLKVTLLPISETNAQIVADLSDGKQVVGEWEAITRVNRETPIIGVHHEPKLEIHPEVMKSIDNARWIIICPGTLWLGIGSILAAPEIKEAISRSKAYIVAIGNLLTQPGVSDGMSMKDHWDALEGMLGRKIDYYIQHDKSLPPEILAKYTSMGFAPVDLDMSPEKQGVIFGDFVSREFLNTLDRIHYDPSRGYPHAVRHDPNMLAKIFLHLSQDVSPEVFNHKPKEERYEVKDF